MLRFVISALGAAAIALPAAAQVQFPAEVRTQEITTNGATIHVRVGGTGPAVVLLHGYGETGDMWAPLAEDLVRDHTVVVPDLRGLGLSSKPEAGLTRRHRPATWQAFSTHSRSIAPIWSRTTSATWSATPLRSSTRNG